MVRGTATEWWRAQRTGVKRGTMLYVYGYQSGVVHNYTVWCTTTGVVRPAGWAVGEFPRMGRCNARTLS